MKALGKTLLSEISVPECAGGFAMGGSLQDGLAAWLLAVREVQQHSEPFPLALLCPRLTRVCLCISLPSCRVGTAEWQPRAGTGACVQVQRVGENLILFWP